MLPIVINVLEMQGQKMVSFINAVSESLLTAFSHCRAAETAVGVYESAKARGDQAVMKRALAYASPEITGAIRQSREIARDLKKAREKAREEEKEVSETREKKTGQAEKTTGERADGTTVEHTDDSIEKTGSGQSESEATGSSLFGDLPVQRIDLSA